MSHTTPTPDDFFAGNELSRRIFDAVAGAVEATGPSEVSVGKSQVGFRRRRGFAYAWMPAKYLGRGAPLVLTVMLRRRDPSSRWKEVVEAAPGRFTHHLELRSPEEVDDQVVAWLREAREWAG